MKLDWYRGIGPLLETDPCFSYDHVSTYYQNQIRHYTMGGGGGVETVFINGV